MPKTFRTLVLLLALAAVLGMTAVSTSPAHFHLNSSQNRCELCFTAHMAAVQSPSAQPIHGLEISGRATLLLPYSGYHSIKSQPSFSRGPPSFCL
jgi:hypothetical protein